MFGRGVEDGQHIHFDVQGSKQVNPRGILWLRKYLQAKVM